jgi:type II secretory pathway component PulM
VTLPFDLRALWERALAWYNGYSERDRRIILGILIATGLSLVYIGIVEPILDYRKEVGKRIADGQEQLERSMRLVGAKDMLRAEREDLRKRLAQAKARLLPGGTATLGAAALQERANALASEKGIAVQSTQVMKEENVDPFRKVAVRLTLSGELKPLAELVSGIEYGQQLNVPFVEINRRGAVAGAKGPRTLSATVEVSGFVQGGASSKPEGSEGEAAPTVEAQAEGTAPGGEGTGAAVEGGAPPPSDGGPPADGSAPPPGPAPAGDAAAAGPGGTPPVGGGAPVTVMPPVAGAAPVPGAAPLAGAAPITPTTTADAAGGATASTLTAASTIVPISFPPMVFPTTVPATVPPPSATKPPPAQKAPPGAPKPPPPAHDEDDD